MLEYKFCTQHCMLSRSEVMMNHDNNFFQVSKTYIPLLIVFEHS